MVSFWVQWCEVSMLRMWRLNIHMHPNQSSTVIEGGHGGGAQGWPSHAAPSLLGHWVSMLRRVEQLAGVKFLWTINLVC